MSVTVTLVFASDKPLINKLALAALVEINEMLEPSDEAAVKLSEFIDYAEVLDGEPDES